MLVVQMFPVSLFPYSMVLPLFHGITIVPWYLITPLFPCSQQSQLPQSVKRAALNALVKKRETVVVPNLSGQVALVVGGM